MALKIIIGVIFTVVGICFASFCNVLIYRLPRKESLIKPSSHCPQCDHALSWYENIPIISYIFLKGRCKQCKEKISPRYIIVESIGGILFLLAYLKFGVSVDGIIIALALLLLLTISFIDAEHLEIPLTLNICLFVLAVSKLVGNIIVDHSYPYYHYLIGFGGAAVIFILIYVFSLVVLKKEGLGLGDVILFSSIGLLIGWAPTFLVMLFSSLICSIVLIILISLKKMDKDKPIAFGPFIAGSAMIIMFYSNEFTNFIMGLF